QTFTFSFTTTAVLNAGTVVNTVSVTGHDDENSPASGQDSHTLTVTNVTPTITVDKTAPATMAEGNTVTYGFAITNTSPASTDPVTITSVVDSVLGDLTSAASPPWVAQGHRGATIPDPSQTFSFNFPTLTALNAGTVVNTVSVSGHDDENTPASASDTATVFVTNVTPTITVDKTAPATMAEGNTAIYGLPLNN